jgi:hypothetical protein
MINVTGLKNNAQHLMGVLVGVTALRITGLRYGKEHRGARWFSTVAANLTADGEPITWAPYRVWCR